MKNLPSLSIVLPCYNEQEVIMDSYKHIKILADNWVGKIINSYEIVLVNNGSKDSTLIEMKKIFEMDNNVVIVDLRTNYGHQSSFSAGLFNASNDMIVTIDADLQDPPEMIENMIQKYNEGYELVLGVRNDRSSDSFFKRFFAENFYKFLKLMGANSVHNHGEFRLMSRSLVENLKKYGERNRFLRSLILELDQNYATVGYKRRERQKGYSKCGIFDLLSFGVEGVTSFSVSPIRFVFWLGMFLFIISLLLICWVFYIKFILKDIVPGWATISVVTLFFFGLQNLSLGIIGEYIGKIYIETKQRPLFLIKKKYTHNRSTE